jgi:hypothetical protein
MQNLRHTGGNFRVAGDTPAWNPFSCRHLERSQKTAVTSQQLGLRNHRQNLNVLKGLDFRSCRKVTLPLQKRGKRISDHPFPQSFFTHSILMSPGAAPASLFPAWSPVIVRNFRHSAFLYEEKGDQAMSSASVNLDELQIEDLPPAPSTAANWRHYLAQLQGSPLNQGSEQGALDAESTAKKGNMAMTAASTGVTIAQQAAGVSTLGVGKALVVGGAAAAGATGIGLVAAGVVLTVGSSVQSGVSYSKTKAHLAGLIKIYDERDKYADCMCIVGRQKNKTPANDRQHQLLANQVLLYIISQKDKKKTKKGWGIVPGVGTAKNTAQSVWHNVNKRWDGTLGVQRNRAGHWLAYHFMSSNCRLADAIIDELLGAGSNKNFDRTDYDVLSDIFANKMKSI